MCWVIVVLDDPSVPRLQCYSAWPRPLAPRCSEVVLYPWQKSSSKAYFHPCAWLWGLCSLGHTWHFLSSKRIRLSRWQRAWFWFHLTVALSTKPPLNHLDKLPNTSGALCTFTILSLVSFDSSLVCDRWRGWNGRNSLCGHRMSWDQECLSLTDCNKSMGARILARRSNTGCLLCVDGLSLSKLPLKTTDWFCFFNEQILKFTRGSSNYFPHCVFMSRTATEHMDSSHLVRWRRRALFSCLQDNKAFLQPQMSLMDI